MGVIARVPLDEGSLGGRLTLETRFPPDDWRSLYFGPENLAPTVSRVERFKQIVPACMTLPELDLHFILRNPVVSTIVIGMRSRDHVAANVAASGGAPLDTSVMEELRCHRWDRNSPYRRNSDS